MLRCASDGLTAVSMRRAAVTVTSFKALEICERIAQLNASTAEAPPLEPGESARENAVFCFVLDECRAICALLVRRIDCFVPER
jgi:hypothetical protein